MSQVDPDQYRIIKSVYVNAVQYAVAWDKTNSLLALLIDGTAVFTINSSGTILAGALEAADLNVASQARGDILRRGASAWERISGKDSGKILLGDGTDIISAAVSGDATIGAAGALTVTDVTVGSDAAGDLLYKSSATALARLAKGTGGQLLQMNSGATAPEWSSTPVLYKSVAVSSGELLAINATPKTLVAAAAGSIHVVHRAILVYNYVSAAYANNGVLGIYENNAAGTLLTGTLTLASFLAQTADTIKELHPTAASATTGLTRLDNKALVLTQATGESITGDSPITVHLWYSTIAHGL